MSKNRKPIVIEVTPEMIKRKKELNEQTIKDQERLRRLNQSIGNMQSESMAAANRLDNNARYGTSDFVQEKGYTKKMRFK